MIEAVSVQGYGEVAAGGCQLFCPVGRVAARRLRERTLTLEVLHTLWH